MHPIHWQQYGLKRNPFDILPLVEGGELEIESAFVGRTDEQAYISSVIANETHVCIAICGDAGVGKTTLANKIKHTWKNDNKKPLFSFRREIEAQPSLLNKKIFILEIIGSVIREIQLIDQKLLQLPLLKKLHKLVDISNDLSLSFSGGISVGIFGGNIGIDKKIDQPLNFSMSSLEQHLVDLVKFIRTHRIARKKYDGLIVHMNNFDVALEQDEKTVISFFNEIRDLIQTPHIYFLFLGPKNFFSNVIAPNKRIKSIFNQPNIQLEPLQKNEIIQAFHERMEILKSEKIKKFIAPVSDSVFAFLYDFHQGDIRSIMASIVHILSIFPATIGQTLDMPEAVSILGKWQWEQLDQSVRLTNEQKEILITIARSQEPVNQKEIAKKFNKAQTNISGYYFKPLRDEKIIEIKSKIGREKFWHITEKFSPMKKFIQEITK